MECQMLRQPPAGHHMPHAPPGHQPRPGPGLGLPMFRRPPPSTMSPEPGPTKLSPEERLLLARTQLLRAQTPFSGGVSPTLAPLRPGHLGLHHLMSQWSQLQQLNSALMSQSPAAPAVSAVQSQLQQLNSALMSPQSPAAPAVQSPAALFSNILSQAQRFSPYVISPPSPPQSSSSPRPQNSPSSSRSQSPIQVEA